MGRGNRGAEIFREDRDREIFIDTLVETVDRTGWLIHAWVLMSTHYHILLETPEANLVAGMRWFPGTFTQRYNAYHQEYGHLFQGRYKAKLIDDEEPSYFRSVADYIHLNPATAGLLDPENPDLATYRWSSFPDYLNPPSKHPSWLETGRVFSCHHIQRNTPTGRRAFEALMAEKTQWVLREKGRRVWQKQWRQHDRGWIHGANTFKKRMSEMIAEGDDAGRRTVYDREQKRGYGEAAAENALMKAWEVVKLDPDDLGELKKGDRRKLLLAGWLRAHYSVDRKWVAHRLCLGHPSRIYEGVILYESPPVGCKRMREALDKISKLSG